MAEFCWECFKKLNNIDESEAKKYAITKQLDLCEGCADLRHVVIGEKRDYYRYKFRIFLFPFKLVYLIVYCFIRLLMMPYLIIKYIKYKNK